MGLGRIFHRKYRDRTGKLKPSKRWTLEYYVPGESEKRREPAGTADQQTALALLRTRQEQIGKVIPVGPAPETVSFADLATLITTDYAVKRNRSTKRLVQILAHLTRTFLHFRAVAITSDRIMAYVQERQSTGAADATINRELAALRRMFRLAVKHRRLLSDHVPPIELLPEHNIRQGIITPFQMSELLRLLPLRVAAIAEVTYITGWRAFSDVLTRRWEHVQWDRGLLLLETGEGKARKARKFPLFPRLRAILEAQRRYTDTQETLAGVTIPWVFHHRSGRPVGSYRRTWITACRNLGKKYPDWGCETWIRHRMRYSAVENLLAAGIAVPDILKMVGMTMATFNRYHQQSEAGILRAGVRLDDFYRSMADDSNPAVLPFVRRS